MLRAGKQTRAGNGPLRVSPRRRLVPEKMQVVSDLEAAGRALAETSAEDFSCLAFAIFGELERREKQHNGSWPTGWPRDPKCFRSFIWEQIKMDIPRFISVVRMHGRATDQQLQQGL